MEPCHILQKRMCVYVFVCVCVWKQAWRFDYMNWVPFSLLCAWKEN